MVEATLADLQSGWRTVSNEEKPICETLLERAAAMVSVAFGRAGVDPDALGSDEQTVIVSVICDMVQSAMVNAREYSTVTDSEIYGEAPTWELQPIGGWLRITDNQMAQLGLSSYIGCIRAKNITDEHHQLIHH